MSDIVFPLLFMAIWCAVLGSLVIAFRLLWRLRATTNRRVFTVQTLIGFGVPLVILFIWERLLSTVISFNVVSIVWLFVWIMSWGAVAVPSARLRTHKIFASGLLLGCNSFFVCAFMLVALD